MTLLKFPQNDAYLVLEAVQKVVSELIKQDKDEDYENYINYVLFRFSGFCLLNEYGPEKLTEIFHEIKMAQHD